MLGLFKKKVAPVSLFFSTDIHCHVIPGIDDGSPDVATSVELMERMQGWGVNRIIATPHVTMGTFENTPSTIRPALLELKAALSASDSKIEISHSAEYRIDENFIKQLEVGNIVAMPNNHLLVENSFIQEPWGIDQLLFELKVKGYIPILAHPERYAYYYGNKRGRYDELHSTGTMFQVNLLSLAGYYGSNERKWAEYLLGKGYIDFIGTDLHNHRHADCIEKFLSSKEYRKLAANIVVKNDTAFN